jgi:beta-glucosidase
VQLYIGDDATTEVVRPVRELKGFQKVNLAPGESRTVRFTLSARDFSYYDVHRKSWVANAGSYRIAVGSSSRDIRQTRAIQWIVPCDPRAPDKETPAAFDFF